MLLDRFKNHSSGERSSILLISLFVSIIFLILVVGAFREEYEHKLTTQCYQETKNILCFDDKFEIRLSSGEDELTGEDDHGEYSALPLSLFFLPGYLIFGYMLLLSIYATYLKTVEHRMSKCDD